MKKTNRLLAIVLSLMMLFQSAPLAAFAEGPDSSSESYQIGIIDDNSQGETDIETDETVRYRDEKVPKENAGQISIDVDYVNEEHNALGEDFTKLQLPAFEEELDLFMFSAHRYGSIKKWWKRVAIRITLHILLIYTLISAMFMIFSDDDRLVHSQNSEVRRIAELTDIRVMILITAHAFVFLTAWLILRLFIKNAVISTILLLVLEDISVIYVSKMFSNTLFIPSAWGIFGMSDVISKGGYNIWMAVFIEIVFYIVAVFLLGRKLRNLHSLNT